MQEIILVLGAIVGLLTLALVVFIVILMRRASASNGVEALSKIEGRFADIEKLAAQIDKTVRDELSRGRDETASGARLLREEVTGAFGILSEGTRGAMRDLGEAQHARLDDFSGRLEILKSDAGANAASLRDQVTQSLTQLGENVRTTISSIPSFLRLGSVPSRSWRPKYLCNRGDHVEQHDRRTETWIHAVSRCQGLS